MTVGVLLLLLAALVVKSRLPPALKAVLVAALALRVVGGVLRYEILYGFYDGSGDAAGYYGKGLVLADHLRALDFGAYARQYGEYGHGMLGTHFMYLPSSLVLAVVGPSMLGGFVAFSLLSFLGLWCFVVAFRRAFPRASVASVAALVLLFPSLWYWPSSIGKEAVVFLGLGLTTLGFVGRGRGPSWTPLLAGLALVFLVRPELGGVLAVVLAVAQLFAFTGRAPSFGRVVSGAALAAVGVLVFWWAALEVGMTQLDPDGVQSFVETHPTRQIDRGTLVEPPDLSPLGAPRALANVLMRPFVWEATNPMVLLSALELIVLWGIVWKRRRHLGRALREWRRHRVLQFAVAFVVVYGLSLGFMVVNAGIIARQRTLLLPLLFLLLCVPASAPARVRIASRGSPGPALRPVSPARSG